MRGLTSRMAAWAAVLSLVALFVARPAEAQAPPPIVKFPGGPQVTVVPGPLGPTFTIGPGGTVRWTVVIDNSAGTVPLTLNYNDKMDGSPSCAAGTACVGQNFLTLLCSAPDAPEFLLQFWIANPKGCRTIRFVHQNQT